MQTYSFKCPGCGALTKVQAENDDEAVDKLMAAGEDHMKQVHPGGPMDPGMADKVRAEMKKGESEEGHSHGA